MAASNTDKFKKLTNNFSTTLSGAIVGASDTSMSLASTTNLPTDTGTVFVIDRVDASGTATPSVREYVVGTVSGSNVTNLVRGVGNSTAQAHSTGAVVEQVVDQRTINDIIDGILQDHAQLGYHKSLTDTNGNTWLGQTATTSAVNYVNNANAATGNAPLLQAAGTDANIGLHIGGKGTSSPHFYGVYDGWVNPNETWTYSSYDSTNKTGVITVPTGAANKYNVGDRVKFTNNSAVQYGIVTKVADTALTVYHGTDYSLTNSAITLNYYSHEKGPVGFPLDPAKWTVSFSSTTQYFTSTTTGFTNDGTHKLPVPIGVWDLSYEGIMQVTVSSNTSASGYATLSSANNSESDTDYTVYLNIGGASGNISSYTPVFKHKIVNLSSATTYYLNLKLGTGSFVEFRGDNAKTQIKAVCAYL